MANVGDLVILRKQPDEKCIIVAKRFANFSGVNIPQKISEPVPVYYVLLSSYVKIQGPLFETEFYLM